MIIYKLDRKHHFYTQYKSHLLGWKLQPLRNLWKQLYKNINIFIFTGCQTFIPWQLMSEKALQIIESMVADNKKYILWFKYCLISLVKSAYCDFSFFLHPVQVTVNETSKHQEAGLMWEIPSPTVFFLFVCFGHCLWYGEGMLIILHVSWVKWFVKGEGLPVCLPPTNIFKVEILGTVKWSSQHPNIVREN